MTPKTKAEKTTNLNDLPLALWTRKQFEALPMVSSDHDKWCDSLVILPVLDRGGKPKLRGSGYPLLDFVAIRDRRPVFRISGCSDFIRLGLRDGDRDEWSLDVLPGSGLIHTWPTRQDLYEITFGIALSTFETWLTQRIHR